MDAETIFYCWTSMAPVDFASMGIKADVLQEKKGATVCACDFSSILSALRVRRLRSSVCSINGRGTLIKRYNIGPTARFAVGPYYFIDYMWRDTAAFTQKLRACPADDKRDRSLYGVDECISDRLGSLIEPFTVGCRGRVAAWCSQAKVDDFMRLG